MADINLPSLNDYKNTFVSRGIKLPLKTIQANPSGLLTQLPPPPPDKTGWPWTEETNPLIYDAKINWPKLTIVTPSYNQDQFLEQTIRSVLLQNYPNLEYIVIDGGSTDTSRSIIEKYTPWISYWQSETDRGQSHAINLGFSLASGTYYSWINSDDYYLKGVFHKVANTFWLKKANFIYGYVYNYITEQQQLELVKVVPLLDYFIRIPSLVQPSCFWNAKIHQPVWEELQCSLDYELWLRLVKGQTRKLIKEPLSVASVHQDAKTYAPKMKVQWQHDHELICSADAHGPVTNWDTMIFLHRIYIRLISLINK